MCTRSITIKNVSYVDDLMYKRSSVDFQRSCNLRPATLYSHLKVPCGTCYECSRVKQNSVAQRCNAMLKTHFAFYGTLTYKNDMLPSYNASDGNVYHYADINDFRLMVKRLRKRGELPQCKYYVFTEYGSEKHRPHFHFILFISKMMVRSICSIPDYVRDYSESFYNYILKFENDLYWTFRNGWKRRIGGTVRNPIYEPLFEYHERWIRGKKYANYDFHFVRQLEEHTFTDVFMYVSKYCVKFDKWLDKLIGQAYHRYEYDEYKRIRQLMLPKCRASLYLGIPVSIDKTLKSCKSAYDRFLVKRNALLDYFSDTLKSYVNTSDINYRMVTYDPETGVEQPLCRYFAKKLLDFKDLVKHHINVFGSVDQPSYYPDREDGDIASRLAAERRAFAHLSDIMYDDIAVNVT